MSYRIINPVLSGFYPSPSVCNANGPLYMVTSSFTYFPGLPIFTSKNGVSWTQIGNIITEANPIELFGHKTEGRLLAPTLRYYEGKFFCVCGQAGLEGETGTLPNVETDDASKSMHMFLTTAENPAGPWSKPVTIKGAVGDDPSLYFDDDGTVWYVGVEDSPEKFYETQKQIYAQRIDVNKAELFGEKYVLIRSVSKNSEYFEAPHLFMHNDRYYVVYSEGGTGLNHAVCIARADSIDGEWETKCSNPILTHRNMGLTAGVSAVGHGDMYADKDGRWWLAVSAVRPYGEKTKRAANMGRETFFVPVRWEDEWPVVACETGHIDNAYSLSGVVVTRAIDDADAVIWPTIDDFNEGELKPYWVGHRNMNTEYIRTREHSGNLTLYGGAPLQSEQNLAMVIRRQTSFCYEACTCVNCFFADDGDCAGIVCYQNERFNLRLQIKLSGKVILLQFIKTVNGNDEIVKEDAIDGGMREYFMVLRIVAEKQFLKFEYGPDERNMNVFAEKVDSCFLAPDRAGGYSGVMVGMFAVAGGDFTQKRFRADFDWFKFETITRDWTS